jgi:dihydrofolate reductase
MKVILSMAVSLNGMVARENGQEDWLPVEGWNEFLVDVTKFNNFIMGRQTYELVQQLYPDHNFDDVDIDPKIIVTRNTDFQAPSSYTIVHSPQEALELLSSRNLDTALLVGGGKLNSQFLKEGLVDEVWLTYTPYILGKGRSFIDAEDLDIALTLLGYEKLSLGRIQTKYSVNKS